MDSNLQVDMSLAHLLRITALTIAISSRLEAEPAFRESLHVKGKTSPIGNLHHASRSLHLQGRHGYFATAKSFDEAERMRSTSRTRTSLLIQSSGGRTGRLVVAPHRG